MLLIVSGGSGAARKLRDPVLPAGGRGSKLHLVFFPGAGPDGPAPGKKNIRQCTREAPEG